MTIKLNSILSIQNHLIKNRLKLVAMSVKSITTLFATAMGLIDTLYLSLICYYKL